MKRVITIIVIIAIIGLVAFRLTSNKKEIDSKKQVKDTSGLKVSVNVAKVKLEASETSLTMVGTVVPDKEIEVKSEVQGKITALNVELGDYVKKGQTLARIDDKLRSISLSTAQQNLAKAERDLERYNNLYKGGAATEAQLQQYQLTSDNAKNQLAQAQKELSNTGIAAPISGYVTQKMVESGAFANIGASIVTIVDVSQLKVQVNVAENDVYTLKAGNLVSITTNVYPGVTFEGKITFISPRGDDAHNYPVEIAIKNQDKNPLKAGTYVDINFNRKSNTATLQIPREALVGSIKDAQVYVVENGVAKLKKLTIGADNGSALVVMKGLTEGETVVTTGQINLANNTPVIVNQ